MYGLRETTAFDKALRASVGDDTSNALGDIIDTSPFEYISDPLLFPFMILEAKSEKGDGFAAIEKQTAFSIRTLLKLQYDLHSKTDIEGKRRRGPLVFFLSNRGEEWKVAGAFTDKKGKSVQYVSIPKLSTSERCGLCVQCVPYGFPRVCGRQV